MYWIRYLLMWREQDSESHERQLKAARDARTKRNDGGLLTCLTNVLMAGQVCIC